MWLPPEINLLAGKNYTVSFKARVMTGTASRLVSIGLNSIRSLRGTSVFFSEHLPTNSYSLPPFKEFNPTFTIPASGRYFLTFNFTENGYTFTYLDEITVEETHFPLVNIASPSDGGSINEDNADSTKVLLTANASDTDGTITKLEFYVNNVKIGEDLTAPCQFLMKDILPNNYVYTAKVFDNRGNTTISLPINYRVHFRDGTFKKYVNLDFNSTNLVRKGLDY